MGQASGVSRDLKYAHISIDDKGIAFLERLPRIRVAQIVADHLAHGWNAAEICREYPHLRPAEVHSAFAYYFDHVEGIEEEIERELEEADKRAAQDPSPLRSKLKKLRSA